MFSNQNAGNFSLRSFTFSYPPSPRYVPVAIMYNAQLVCQHLESISRAALEEYQNIIRQYVRGRYGIYVLYRKGKLYYVGLATNLRNRLK